MRRAYISGPMSGLPDFNYPAFNAEAARLRALGYHVENPAENPERSCWEDYMKVAIRQMLTCDVVVMLPGWRDSRGANIERAIAIEVGIEVAGQHYPRAGYSIRIHEPTEEDMAARVCRLSVVIGDGDAP